MSVQKVFFGVVVLVVAGAVGYQCWSGASRADSGGLQSERHCVSDISRLPEPSSLDGEQKPVLSDFADDASPASDAVRSEALRPSLDPAEEDLSQVEGVEAAGSELPPVKPQAGVEAELAPVLVLAPMPGLTVEEQRRSNEEAQAFVLPIRTESPDDEGGEVTGAGGAIMPTPAELAYEREHGRVVKKVLLNKIGFARINAERSKRGQKPLVAGRDVQVAPVGKDMVMDPANEAGIEDRATRAVGDNAPETTGAVADQEAVAAASLGEEPVPDDSAMPGAGDTGATPSSVDNSFLKYFPPIGNQNWNSCAPWATTYYNLTHETAIQRDWDAKTGGPEYICSPMFIYNFVSHGNGSGTQDTEAYDIHRDNGCVRQSEASSFNNYKIWLQDNPDAYRRALSLRTDGHVDIRDLDTESGLQILKDHLANGHIASFNCWVGSWQYKSTGDDPSTTEDDPYVSKSIAYTVNGTALGHTMTVVGYNDDIWCDIDGDGTVDANEKGALRIANQWGTGWKDGGYCWVAYHAFSNDIFWGNSVRAVKPRSELYEPKLVAKVTYSHNKRNQLKGAPGVSQTFLNYPNPNFPMKSSIVSHVGGALAFSGASPAYQDFEYYLDFTERLPALGVAQRYYLTTVDSGTNDGEATIKQFDLYYIIAGVEYYVASAAGLPVTVNGATDTRYIEWTYVEPTTVSVSLTDDTASEEGSETETGSWTVTRTGETTEALDINFVMGGTASNGVDYNVSPESTVTIPIGQASMTITLTVIDDSVEDEPVETATLMLAAGAGYAMADPDGGSVSILDNDYAVPIVAAEGATLGLGFADMSWNLTSDGGTSTSVTVYWGTPDQTNDTGSWEHSIDVGVTDEGVGSSTSTTNSLPTLLHDVDYFYRVSASNIAGVGWSETKSFKLINIGPTANAGSNQTVHSYDQVTLDGSGSSDSDAYPSAVTYSWTPVTGPTVTVTGTNTANPTFTPTVAGSYVFQLEVSDGEDTHVHTVTVTVLFANTIPYAESFESYEEGFQLAGTNGWAAASADAAVVATNNYSYAGELPISGAHERVLDVNGTVSNSFGDTANQTNVWVDMMVQCWHWEGDMPTEVTDEASTAVLVDTNGCLRILNDVGTSNAWTIAPDTSIASGEWVRLTIHKDYTPGNERFRLWLNGIAVTNPSTWYDSANSITKFTSCEILGRAQIDDLVVTDADPLSPVDPADQDGDGIPDTWELANGLSTSVNNFNIDSDNDGRSDFEEYIADTDPTNKSSIFKHDLSPSDQTLSWHTSSNRLYTLWSSTNLSEWTRVPQMSNMPGTDGTMVFTIESSAPNLFFKTSVTLPN